MPRAEYRQVIFSIYYLKVKQDLGTIFRYYSTMWIFYHEMKVYVLVN